MDIITYALLKKKINEIASFSFKGFKKVSILPPIGDPQYIYLLPNDKNNENKYDEYLWVDNRWEVIGSLESDFQANYYTPSVDKDGNLTWVPSQDSLPSIEPVNIKGPKGDSITGAAGVNGRSVELRKTAEAFEWKLSSEIELSALYNSAGSKTRVFNDDTITRINLLGCPNKAVYGKIKTVTGYGVDAQGKDVVNVNCSAASPGDFPFLGGFNPKKAEIVLSDTKTIHGDMNIATAQEGLLKLLSGTPAVKVNKVRLWIYFLDVDKKPLGTGNAGDGGVLLDIFITDSPNEWKVLTRLEDLETYPDEKSVVLNQQGKLAIAGFEQAIENQIPMKQKDDKIQWTSVPPAFLSGDIKDLIQTEIIEFYGGSATDVMEV